MFNETAFDYVIRDSYYLDEGGEAASARTHVSDLSLPAMGLLKIDVRVCVPWEASTSASGEPLRLRQARALMRCEVWDLSAAHG